MKYYIKQKVFSLKDKFTVKDANDKDVYQVQGKVFSLTNKLELLKMDGSQALNAKKKLFRFLPLYNIYSPHDDELAEVKRLLAFKPKFLVTVGNTEYNVEGTLFAHTFQIYKDEQEVASITKKVVSFGDTYEIDILDENNKELFLFIVIIIDQIVHENKNKNFNINV